MLVGCILAMNHLTNDDKERLLSQMRKMDYVTSYDMMQRKGTMYQVMNYYLFIYIINVLAV